MLVFSSTRRKCNTAKLREHPKALSTKLNSKGFNGRGNDLGYGKNLKDFAMGNPQPSPKSFKDMDAVQRLDGSGCFFFRKALKI